MNENKISRRGTTFRIRVRALLNLILSQRGSAFLSESQSSTNKILFEVINIDFLPKGFSISYYTQTPLKCNFSSIVLNIYNSSQNPKKLDF